MSSHVDWGELLKEHGKCCACEGSLKNSENINLVAMDYIAAWSHPAWGNILARDPDKRTAKRATAIVCDKCVEEKRSPHLAVEFRRKGRRIELIYHLASSLEKAEPITLEDLEPL